MVDKQSTPQAEQPQSKLILQVVSERARVMEVGQHLIRSSSDARKSDQGKDTNALWL